MVWRSDFHSDKKLPTKAEKCKLGLGSRIQCHLVYKLSLSVGI